jgi:hypothetical protein
MLSSGIRPVGINQQHSQLDDVWRNIAMVERLIQVNFN